MYCVLADGRTNYSTKYGIAPESAKSGISSIKVFTCIKTIPQFEDNENKVTINFIVYFVIICVKYY